MTRKQFFQSACVPILAFGLLTACAPQDTPAEGSAKTNVGYLEPDHKAAIAILQPTSHEDDVGGVVTFEKTTGGKIRVHARVTGLEPGSEHGFHIHEFGDLSAEDGKSAGGHFNPENKPHDIPPESERHAGDLGNIKANAEGVAEKTIEVSKFSLGGENSVLGRAVIVHAKPDTGGEPSGDAGNRIAYGVIGLKGPEPESKK